MKDKRFMQSMQSKNQMLHRESTNKRQQSKLRFIALTLYYIMYTFKMR